MIKYTQKIKLFTCLLASVFLLLTPAQIFATNDFYSSNDILFYNAKDNICLPTNYTGTDVNSSENLTKILTYFTEKGLSLAAAAGIAGNMFQESGYNPAKIEGGATAPDNYIPVNGVGFGLVQWTHTSRQQPLVDFAKLQGKNITDFEMQLDYTWQELNTGYTTTLQGLNNIKSTSTFGTTSAPMAAAIVFHGYTDLIYSGATKEITDVISANIGFSSGVNGMEGSDDTAQMVVDNRGKPAEAAFSAHNGTISDGTGVVGISTAVAGASIPNCPGTTIAGDATWPDNVIKYSKGWTIKDDTDYSNVQCAAGSIDDGTYYHPIRKFIIRKCSTKIGVVSSLISQKALSMIAAAAQNGVTLTGGGWRSYESQISLRIRKIEVEPGVFVQNCPDIHDSPSSSCIIPTARPGNSQHEKGLAIDFDDIGKVGSGPSWDWLVANAASYGFYNLASEGWHWSMSGG